MEYTPEIGLALPKDGSKGWGDPAYGENFRKISTEIGALKEFSAVQGTATAGSASTLTDSTLAMGVDAFKDGTIIVRRGTLLIRAEPVLSNTANGFVVASGAVMAPGDKYTVTPHIMKRSISNIAALRTAPFYNGAVVDVEDYDTLGKGGGDRFVCLVDDPGTFTEDYGTTIIPTGITDGSTAWLRYTRGMKLNVCMWGAKRGAAIDASLAFQRMVNAVGYIDFVGDYLLDSAVDIPTTTVAGRAMFGGIFGIGRKDSSVLTSFAGYAFVYPGGDNIRLEGFRLDAPLGGGISVNGDCGGFYADDFFMNNCADGFAAIKWLSGKPYTFKVTNSRFWSNTGYFGMVFDMTSADGGINVVFKDSFISQQKRDGDIMVIKNCNGFITDNVQFEGSNSASTNQCFVAFLGSNFSVDLRGMYLEGKWNKGVRVAATASVRGLHIGTAYVWETAGKPSPVFLDLASVSTEYHVSGVTIDGLTYINSDTGAGTGYIIDDPLGIIKDDIKGYRNNSTGAQLNRVLTQNIHKNQERGVITTASLGIGATMAETLQLPDPSLVTANKLYGEYELTLMVYSADRNHATSSKWRVVYDAGHTINFAQTEQLGSSLTKGAQAPTLMTCGVSTAGVVSIGAYVNNASVYTIQYEWTRKATGI